MMKLTIKALFAVYAIWVWALALPVITIRVLLVFPVMFGWDTAKEFVGGFAKRA